MHDKLSVLSKIIPSALPVSPEHPLPICVPLTIYPKSFFPDWHLEAAVVSGCSEPPLGVLKMPFSGRGVATHSGLASSLSGCSS